MYETQPKGRGRPRKVSVDDELVQVKLRLGVIARLEAEWHRRRLRTRADTLRAILDEVLPILEGDAAD